MWRAAAVVAVPLWALILIWCLVPRSYYTGTDSVEDYTYVAQTPAHQPMCVFGLRVPASTSRLRLRLISATTQRPVLHLALRTAGRVLRADLGPAHVEADRISTAIFTIPLARVTAGTSSLCLTADGLVNWGGTPTPEAGGVAPTLAGRPLMARIAVWYLPSPGAARSYVSEAGDIFARAALFRPGFVGAWTYPFLLFLVIPLLALAAVRCLALAVAGRMRRLSVWLYVIVALNACCWALITPVFQGPDEVDHFAYTQSLAERGQGPSRVGGPARPRWSSAENAALAGAGFFTDHQVGDTKAPWLAADQRAYESAGAHATRRDDGGGLTTSSTHGPLYYLALTPAYLAAGRGSVLAQLTLMRFASALIGALSALFTFLLARELAPGRPWLGVLAALLVGFEPMYGFISGIVNNDVGVDAGAAALEYLLIRMLHRGVNVRWGVMTGALLAVLPIIKGTGESLYPIAALVLLAALWRHHRSHIRGLAAVVIGAVAVNGISSALNGVFRSSQGNSPGAGSNLSATSAALHDPHGYLSYLWQVFLPRLSFMAPHFQGDAYPAFVIFVERGWGAFGWYDVFWAPWVYSVIVVVMALTPLLSVWGARREWSWVRRHWMECVAVILMPVTVIAGFEAAFYTRSSHPAIAEFGRYVFPAIGPLALLVVGALHAFGRERMVALGAGLLVAALALSYAGQLVTLTGFYA